MGANSLSGFVNTDPSTDNGKNLYPGQETCSVSSPHALWHQQSATGFLEIALLADVVNGYTKKNTMDAEELVMDAFF